MGKLFAGHNGGTAFFKLRIIEVDLEPGRRRGQGYLFLKVGGAVHGDVFTVAMHRHAQNGFQPFLARSLRHLEELAVVADNGVFQTIDDGAFLRN